MKHIVTIDMTLAEKSDLYVCRPGDEAELSPSVVVWIMHKRQILKQKYRDGEISEAVFQDYSARIRTVIECAGNLFKESIKSRVQSLYRSMTDDQKNSLNPFKIPHKNDRKTKPVQSSKTGKKIDSSRGFGGVAAIENAIANWDSFADAFRARGDDIVFDPGNGWKFQIVADPENPLELPNEKKSIPKVPVDDVKMFLELAYAFPGSQIYVKDISKNRYGKAANSAGLRKDG